MSCRPTGRPSARPTGMERPGRPATLTGSVQASAAYIDTGSSALSPRRNAVPGAVGLTTYVFRLKIVDRLVVVHPGTDAVANHTQPDPKQLAEPQTASTSAESTALSKDLKKQGWKFVGPTTVYAFMQAMGLVNDHVTDCAIRGKVEKARKSFRRPGF